MDQQSCLGQYRILNEVGRGGYGCVYKARHELMNRVVALKVISPELVKDEKARAWFRREVLAATQLNHPNIATAFDANEIDGTLFFAMEFIDGPTLGELVRESGPLPISLACEMLHQAARALQFAHEQGMVHRDIKPANLLIPREAVAAVQANPSLRPRPVLLKIVDFGLARLNQSTTAHTLHLRNERGFVGTPDYVSPEQARDIHKVDIRSDLYSLGCTFYFALTGRRPFWADTAMEVIIQHLEKEPDPVNTYRPEIPAPLAGIIRRLMAKKPQQRFQTPAELVAELSFFFGAGETTAVASPAAGQTFLSVPRRLPAEANHFVPQASAVLADLPAATVQLPEITPSPQGTVESAARFDATPAPPIQLDQQSDSADPARADVAADATLRQNWQQWTGVLQQLAEMGRWTVSGSEYEALYANLLASCRAHAARAEGAAQTFFRHLEDVVQPWMSPQAVATMDRQTLANLVGSCQQIEFHLGIRKSNSGGWLAAIACLACAAFIGWCILKFQGKLPSLDSWSVRTLWYTLQDHPVLSLTVTLPVVAFVSLTIFGRLLRSS